MANDGNAFKSESPAEARKVQCEKILAKNPGKIPIVCLYSNDIEKRMTKNSKPAKYSKYLLDRECVFGDFYCVLRKRLVLQPTEAVFILVGSKKVLAPSSMLVSHLYNEYKDAEDNFLYLYVRKETAFGSV